MSLIVAPVPRFVFPETPERPAERWLNAGLKSAYILTPSLWQINLVTGQVGGSVAGTGVSFVNDKLRTPGTSGNGALLAHGLALNVAAPVSMVVGCTFVSGSTTWSLLRNINAWYGWYGGNPTGSVFTSNNNSFDGSISNGGVGNFAFRHASSTDLTGSSGVNLVTDTTATFPTLVDRAEIALGWARRSASDNPGVADFTHFYAFQGALSNSELMELAAEPWRLWEEQSIWVPVSAAGGNTAALTGTAATSATGTVTLSIDVALTGNQSTASAGIVSADGAINVALTGNTATTATGTTTPSLSLATTGNQVTASSGVVSPDGSITLALIGNAATSAVGTATPSLGLATTGNQVTASVGTVTASVAINVALTGNAATSAVGIVAPSLTVAITGNQTTASSGLVTPPGNVTAALIGVAATSAVGTVTPSISLAITGNGITASVGTVTSVAGNVVALTGNGVVSAVGMFTQDITLSLTGRSVTASIGSLGLGGWQQIDDSQTPNWVQIVDSQTPNWTPI